MHCRYKQLLINKLENTMKHSRREWNHTLTASKLLNILLASWNKNIINPKGQPFLLIYRDSRVFGSNLGQDVLLSPRRALELVRGVVQVHRSWLQDDDNLLGILVLGTNLIQLSFSESYLARLPSAPSSTRASNTSGNLSILLASLTNYSRHLGGSINQLQIH